MLDFVGFTLLDCCVGHWHCGLEIATLIVFPGWLFGGSSFGCVG